MPWSICARAVVLHSQQHARTRRQSPSNGSVGPQAKAEAAYTCAEARSSPEEMSRQKTADEAQDLRTSGAQAIWAARQSQEQREKGGKEGQAMKARQRISSQTQWLTRGRAGAVLVSLVLVVGVAMCGIARAVPPAPGWTVDSQAIPSNFATTENEQCTNSVANIRAECDQYRVTATAAG
jgi:hypothetical protein